MDRVEYMTKILNDNGKQFDLDEDKNTLYHYCSIEVCNEILKYYFENENQLELFATNYLFFNDTEELKNGENILIKLMRKKIKELNEYRGNEELKKFISATIKRLKSDDLNSSVKDLKEVYVTCFCQKNNLLNQWKYYGKNSGVSIEFDFSNCNYEIYKENRYDFYTYPIIYKNQLKKKVLLDKIEKMCKEYEDKKNKNVDINRILSNDFDKIHMLCTLLKHKDFKDEKESRFIVSPLYYESPKDISEQIHYRIKNNIVVPYLKVKIRKTDKISPIIKSITVGPGSNQNVVYLGIKHFLINKSYKDEIEYEKIRDGECINGIILRKSKTPFRD